METMVREWAKRKGISMTELAERCGLSRVHLYNLFRGGWSKKSICRLAAATGIDSARLIIAEFRK